MKITSNQREVLAATDSISGLASAVTATNNRLDVNATVSVAGVSTAVNQTNGLQLTQIVDAGGDLVTVTGGKLDVNATISGAGGGTSSIDKTAFTVGSDTGTPAMGIFQTVLDTVTSGMVAVAAITAKRGQHVNLRDNSGAELGIAAAPLQVSLANTAANATALKVDGSAANQPVTLSAETTKVIGVVRTADGAGNLLTSTGNALDVNLKTSAASVSVSGTVTANAGSNLNTSALALDTSVNGLLAAQASTTLGQSGPLAQTATTTNSPSYLTSKTNPLSTDTSGNLRISLKDTPSNSNNLNVNLAASAATVTVSGTVTTSPPSNASTNIAQINAVTPLMGNGISGTGSLRVTIASDNTAFAVNSTLSAETTKVIGVTRTADGAGNLLTSTGNALDVNLKTSAATVTISGAVTEATLDAALVAQEATTSGVKGLTVFGAVTTAAPTYVTAKSDALSLTTSGALRGDITTIAGTAPSTAGKLDVKGADGDVFVRQATGTNLHVVTDATSVTTATLSAETTKVIGTVNIAASQTIAVTNTGTFATQSTLAAETTKVIGVTRTADGAGNLLTSNSTTYTAKFGLDGNLLGTLGTAFSTAGKVDVKAADGDVFVRQATGTNLHTVLDSGTLTSITNSVTVTATNLSTNVAQVNGATTLAGNGASGTGAQRVTIASDSTGQIAPAANATATGTSIYNNTALSSTKQAVNASAGNLYGYHFYNPNAVVIYIQMFNLGTASVTVGSTAPTCVIAVPSNGWADAPPSGPPITFATALTIAATTTSTGSGTPTTALLSNIWYK